MWSADGKSLYYVSEFHGTPANIVRMPLDADASADGQSQAAKQITFHKDDGVRRARISGNGDWIVYECGADLWVVATDEGGHAAQAGHRGQRRRQDQSRAAWRPSPAAPPSSPCRPTRSTSPSPSTASCSCMPTSAPAPRPCS